MSDFDELVKKAKYAEQAERYQDMSDAMKDLVKKKGKTSLSSEERNLLSVAFKNVVGARRASWRVINSLVSRNKDDTLASTYLAQIKGELDGICGEVLVLLSDYLIPAYKENEEDSESGVFYHKMKGDYLRYLAEVAEGDEKSDHVAQSKEAYTKATEVSEKLASTHPIRLGLALNFSVFHYEVENSPSKACELAKKAFDNAIAELDQLAEDAYKDSTLIMQLLRDNLTLWTSEGKDEEGDD